MKRYAVDNLSAEQRQEFYEAFVEIYGEYLERKYNSFSNIEEFINAFKPENSNYEISSLQ